MRRELLAGIAAGAAGTTALNAVTYLDMVIRARPASSTPDDTVRKAEELADLSASPTGLAGLVLGVGPHPAPGVPATALVFDAMHRR